MLDDSRLWAKPMELIFGKKFKLECWELAVRTMRRGEVASFTTRRVYTHSYPLVAKTLRDTYGPKKKGRGTNYQTTNSYTYNKRNKSFVSSVGADTKRALYSSLKLLMRFQMCSDSFLVLCKKFTLKNDLFLF